jgi:undecaprenyl-diphosphatase
LTTAEAIDASNLDDRPVEIIEPDQEHYVRASSDVIRLVVAIGAFLVTLLAAAILRTVISGAEQDVVHLTSLVPGPISKVLSAAVQTLGYFSPLAAVAALVGIHRVRVALMTAGAAALASGGMWVISRVLSIQFVLPANLGELRAISYPGTSWVAGATAVVTVINPWLPRILRRVGVWSVTVIVITRIATGEYVPYEVAVAVVLGWMCGLGVLYAFGSANRRPNGSSVVNGLRVARIDPVRLEMLGRSVRGSTIYRADLRGGGSRFVKVFDEDQRDTDVLVQAYRWIRLRDAADVRPFSNLRRTVEHEAMMSLAVANDGVPTARMYGVATVDPDAMLLAFDHVDGPQLAGMGADVIGDDLLRELWEIHLRLRNNRIAHRELRLDHFLLPPGGPATLVDFSFGELAATDELLRSDAAELLCSTAVEVGAERAVAAAVDVIGIDLLADTSTRLQPLALSRETRRRIAEQDALLGEVQAEVQRVADLEEVTYEALARIKPRTLVSGVVLVIAFYALLPRLAEVSDIGAVLSQAHWVWILPMLVLMAGTWVGAGVSVVGSVPDRVAFFPMLRAQVAASFVDLLAPAALGGMALNTRFLQKKGVDSAVAVAGVGLNAVAGLVAHVVILGMFLVWAGSSGSAVSDTGTSIDAPSARTTFVILGVLLACIAAAWAVPTTRKLARTRLVPLLRDAGRGLVDLARKPRKLIALFGGSAIITLGFYGALLCSVEAFGGGLTPAQIGVAYLIASTVTIVAPTPGALGALEAALIAAFQRLGLDPDVAVGSVFLFRAATFWLPVLPGWLMFEWMKRNGEL